MAEPVDTYSDSFQINIGPYGCAFNFSLTGPMPQPVGTAPKIDRVATIRMSLEHLKAMTYILHRQIVLYESQAGVSVPLPVEVLRQMQVKQEDWQTFWHV